MPENGNNPRATNFVSDAKHVKSHALVVAQAPIHHFHTWFQKQQGLYNAKLKKDEALTLEVWRRRRKREGAEEEEEGGGGGGVFGSARVETRLG